MSNYSFKMYLQTVEDRFAETVIIKIDFDTFDKKSYQTFHTGLIALCIVLLIMLETLGNFLLLCLGTIHILRKHILGLL